MPQLLPDRGPGSYTAIVQGVNGGTGVGIVEGRLESAHLACRVPDAPRVFLGFFSVTE